jgi:hypothetical protein
MLGSTLCGPLCYLILFFLFLRCLGGVLFSRLGTFLWRTPFLLLCLILTWIWLLGFCFVSDRCIFFPSINLLIHGNFLNQDYNSPVILSILDGNLYVLFFDALSQLYPFLLGILSYVDPYYMPGHFKVGVS